MSDSRENKAAAVASSADIAATAAALGAKESPKFKEKMDGIWGTESTSTDELVKAIDQGETDPIGAKEAARSTPAPAASAKPPVAIPPSSFAPPSDVMPSSAPIEEPAAPAEPAAAVEEDDEPTPEEIASNPKQNNAWTKIRSEKKELKLKVLSLEQQLAAKKSTEQAGAEASRIAELEQQLGQYEERLGQYDVTQTQTFNERYTNPLVSRYNKLVTILSKGSDQATADKIARQLLDPSVNRDELIAGYPITSQAALGATLVEMDDLQAQRDEAIKNWRETKAVLSEQETRQGLSQLNKSIVEDTNKAVEALRMEGNYMYMLSQSDDKWNKGVQERIASLQGLLKSGSKEDMVKLVADGLTARLYREHYEKEHARAEKLASQINAQVKSAPNLGGSGDRQPVVPSKPAKPRPIGAVLNSVWGDDEKF
jgi:hypothetical protein